MNHWYHGRRNLVQTPNPFYNHYAEIKNPTHNQSTIQNTLTPKQTNAKLYPSKQNLPSTPNSSSTSHATANCPSNHPKFLPTSKCNQKQLGPTIKPTPSPSITSRHTKVFFHAGLHARRHIHRRPVPPSAYRPPSQLPSFPPHSPP